MKAALDILEERISAAMGAAAGRSDCAAIVRPATDAKFGDYQANGIMGLAKKLKTNPRELAEEVVKNLDLSDICEEPEVAGPGFINLRLKAEFVAGELLEINKDAAGLGIEKTPEPKTIVVDFSSPNIAKQMHVGHLRSTIIGDCICRMLECLGHKVIRQNHVGDWGLQMGMVIHATRQAQSMKKAIDSHDGRKGPKRFKEGWPLELSDLEHSYRIMSEREKENQQTACAIRESTVRLQRGERGEIDIWKEACSITLNECFRIYRKLSVTLDNENTRGESFYKDMLPLVVSDLQKQGIAETSDDAVCVFPEGFKNKEGEPLPFIIQKSDGAYLYATTDLAALRYRVDELKADAIVYVTDSRQKLH
ncbi:MAG TPA: arginine--tRNA ligase, partial [Sedimentisphaerales bacterium]|nr:arginine--tRNA ligase [Sedimentisphaerales bacterium]